MGKDIIEELKSRGHDVKVIDDYTDMGRGEIILKTGKGSYICASEPRCDGHVAVW